MRRVWVWGEYECEVSCSSETLLRDFFPFSPGFVKSSLIFWLLAWQRRWKGYWALTEHSVRTAALWQPFFAATSPSTYVPNWNHLHCWSFQSMPSQQRPSIWGTDQMWGSDHIWVSDQMCGRCLSVRQYRLAAAFHQTGRRLGASCHPMALCLAVGSFFSDNRMSIVLCWASDTDRYCAVFAGTQESFYTSGMYMLFVCSANLLSVLLHIDSYCTINGVHWNMWLASTVQWQCILEHVAWFHCAIAVYTGSKPHSPDGVASHWQLLYNNSVHWNQATFTWWCYFTLTAVVQQTVYTGSKPHSPDGVTSHWQVLYNSSVHWKQATFTWWCYFTLTSVVQQTVYTGTKPHSPDGVTSHWQLLYDSSVHWKQATFTWWCYFTLTSVVQQTVYTGTKPHSPDGVTSHWQLLYNNSVHWKQATFTWWCCFTLTAIVQ